MLPSFSVIICTYLRPESMRNLLGSLQFQTVAPLEIIIVDASPNELTKELIQQVKYFLPVRYVHADNENKGLTKQRNLGIKHCSDKSEIIVFLDDDLILETTFFKELISTFMDPHVIGSDGFITNENRWLKIEDNHNIPSDEQVFDGYYMKLASRDRLRKKFHLYPTNIQPGIVPLYGHGKSSLPPTGKKYEVDHLMGGLTAYRKDVFSKIKFSEFFEGYGLYEDFDFSVRASKYGKLISNTAAKVSHHHAVQGRPNKYTYGKMVIRNGWYVWRLKHPHPGVFHIIKWYIITILLATLKLSNAFNGEQDKRSLALDEAKGRFVALFILLFRKPKISR